MTLINTVNFKTLGDDRGSLVALEECKDIPFEIKRVYYIFSTKQGVARGFHAHRALRQLAVCVKGQCTMLLDDGKNKESLVLDSQSIGIMIEPMQWHEMHDFSADCVLLVLANDVYDESDYIRNYNEFLELTK
ncbi:WxcM-like domain-containing protein [Vibrio vulnificus]|uniref:sugar 3,4-ketoisomerase n=1 Tax=Vibrio vulnificus TaxID=672 RepID=UPI001EEB1B81|nr:FdtA/QdtA family cupin domain-containing protein [Vibrio vulnificus]EHZ7120553.1 WxcM-like domain-containing protein [Vibrio vulnificus]EJE8737471.1 WxcM-like domain-containing protein [Vibrio vulnificus]EJL7832583.1 WxcM-like domain-containing protein [Vibrio vulnificus]EKO5190440.1 WxcM-like domain-containing protein [Vibrio vulnificus]MCG6275302.1 FdtA/QdtA family cupin domain-containing protein [Vibrio vulnificus]